MHEKRRDHANASGIGGVIHIVRSVIRIGGRSFTHTCAGGLQENVISCGGVEIIYNGEHGGQVGLEMVVSERI
jgi:hypothetical protein